MKKVLFISLLSVLLIAGCISLNRVITEKSPLYMRICSGNLELRDNADKELSELESEIHKETLIKTAGFLRKESDPDTQKRIIDSLIRVEAGSYVVVPLIKAASENSNFFVINTLRKAMRTLPPVTFEESKGLEKYLKSYNWEICSVALEAVGRMGASGEQWIPEIVRTIDRYADNQDRYYRIFQSMAQINPEIATLVVINNLENRNPDIKLNTVNMMLNIYINFNKNLSYVQEVQKSLTLLILSEDEDMSAQIKAKMSELNEDSFSSFMDSGRKLLNTVLKAVGSDTNQMLKSRQNNIRGRIRVFLKRTGREDALGIIKGN